MEIQTETEFEECLQKLLNEGLKYRKCHKEDFSDYYEMKGEKILDETLPLLKKLAFHFGCNEEAWKSMTEHLCKICFANFVIGTSHKCNPRDAIMIFSGISGFLSDMELVQLHALMYHLAEHKCGE